LPSDTRPETVFAEDLWVLFSVAEFASSVAEALVDCGEAGLASEVATRELQADKPTQRVARHAVRILFRWMVIVIYLLGPAAPEGAMTLQICDIAKAIS
jgi:hypothetical protein